MMRYAYAPAVIRHDAASLRYVDADAIMMLADAPPPLLL